MLVDDDRDGDTGGYYLYLKNDGQGFYYWFEHEAGLEQHIKGMNPDGVNISDKLKGL